jgi:nicotinamidase-related amidase
MSISKSDRPALILVDIQKGFDNIEYWGGQRNNLDAENKAGELLKLWRENDLPIFHIKHCSSIPTSLLNESHQGNEFKDIVKPIDRLKRATRQRENNQTCNCGVNYRPLYFYYNQNGGKLRF